MMPPSGWLNKSKKTGSPIVMKFKQRLIFTMQTRGENQNFLCPTHIPSAAKNRESFRTGQIHPRTNPCWRTFCRHGMEDFTRAISAERKSGERNRVTGARAAAILSRDQSALSQERRGQAAGMGRALA